MSAVAEAIVVQAAWLRSRAGRSANWAIRRAVQRDLDENVATYMVLAFRGAA